jgi:SAM-dependent methyltransferase
MIFPEHALAHRLLDGLHGLEIGAAAHNPFGLHTRNVAPLEDFEFYATYSERQGIPAQPVHIWATADKIPVDDGSEDFVISSHVVEHLPNLAAAFLEWDRVVRVGGYIFMIVPLRDALEDDRQRPITPLAHHIEDFYRQYTLDTHPLEGNVGRMGHYHVYTAESLLAVVDWMRRKGLCDWELVAREDIDTKVGNGFTLAFRIVSKLPRVERPALTAPLDSLEICHEIIGEQSRQLNFQWDKAPCLASAEREHRRIIAAAEVERTKNDRKGIWRRLHDLRRALFPDGGMRERVYRFLMSPLRPVMRRLRKQIASRF